LESRYYVIHTDLSDDDAREADLRMVRLAENYHLRTRDFAGDINRKMPFFLYARRADYLAAGGREGTSGFFNGEELVALAEEMGPRTWHAVQHEAFHQFAHFVINADLPPWLNEGMAEYFGEALFTGDSYVAGIVPQWRLQRLRITLKTGTFRSLDEMMRLSQREWNEDLTLTNYDQAWSMVHFLAHGDGGRYQPVFVKFMNSLGRGQRWPSAWDESFGDITGFEQRWRDWWLKLPDDPTLDRQAEACLATLTSHLGRAFVAKQRFTNFEQFEQSARDGGLKIAPADWLPPTLLKNALDQIDAFKKLGWTFSLVSGPAQPLPQIVCKRPGGPAIVSRFVIKNEKVDSVITSAASR
jgi:hypothetical protein